MSNAEITISNEERANIQANLKTIFFGNLGENMNALSSKIVNDLKVDRKQANVMAMVTVMTWMKLYGISDELIESYKKIITKAMEAMPK